MAEARDTGLDNTNQGTDDAYWEGTPQDNQGVYKGFLTLLKISIVIGALVLAFLALTRPAPL